MYGLAYVIIPRVFDSLQTELDGALAPFRRGGDDLFPRSKLAFDDVTDALARLHMTPFRYSSGGLRWREADLGSSLGLRVGLLSEHLAACRLDDFEGTFAEIEPDFDAFVSRFTAYRALDATTLRYGRWLNPVGYWDWWELGGRFNGAITGEPRPAASEHTISSGPSSGRALLTNIVETLGGSEPDEKAQIEANVELLESLAEKAEQRRDSRLPTAVVLPTDYCADEDRWFDCVEWHDIKAGTRAALGVSIDADFATLVRATYGRLPNHAVAGVAYHF